jgi:hypothetical protein
MVCISIVRLPVVHVKPSGGSLLFWNPPGMTGPEVKSDKDVLDVP